MSALVEMDEATYAFRLDCLLTGKEPNIYILLPYDIIKSHPLLKKALIYVFVSNYYSFFESTKKNIPTLKKKLQKIEKTKKILIFFDNIIRKRLKSKVGQRESLLLHADKKITYTL